MSTETAKAFPSTPVLTSLVHSHEIARCAIRSLYAELALYPKPGLVSPVDNGAHDDMSMATFMRSLFSLRNYFYKIASAGSQGTPFGELRTIAIGAEAKMLAATGGVNTHRGAIFNLGLLAAATGWVGQTFDTIRANDVCETVSRLWGEEILASASRSPNSNGSRAVATYGVTGARHQAAEGFLVLRQVTLPCFTQVIARGRSRQDAALQTLFVLMATIEDTNVLHRGGREGLLYLRRAASDFLDAGGVFTEGFENRAIELHRQCVQRRLSPGGSADLLACTLFLSEIQDGV